MRLKIQSKLATKRSNVEIKKRHVDFATVSTRTPAGEPQNVSLPAGENLPTVQWRHTSAMDITRNQSRRQQKTVPVYNFKDTRFFDQAHVKANLGIGQKPIFAGAGSLNQNVISPFDSSIYRNQITDLSRENSLLKGNFQKVVRKNLKLTHNVHQLKK